jgi:LysM repeat protein
LLALLEPCPDKPDCYLYTIRTDDSLGRISRRFGIPVDTILALNPWIVDPSIIHPGEVLTLPPPGR